MAVGNLPLIVDFPSYTPPFIGDFPAVFDEIPLKSPCPQSQAMQRPAAIHTWLSFWTMHDTKLATSTFRTSKHRGCGGWYTDLCLEMWTKWMDFTWFHHSYRDYIPTYGELRLWLYPLVTSIAPPSGESHSWGFSWGAGGIMGIKPSFQRRLPGSTRIYWVVGPIVGHHIYICVYTYCIYIYMNIWVWWDPL